MKTETATAAARILTDMREIECTLDAWSRLKDAQPVGPTKLTANPDHERAVMRAAWLAYVRANIERLQKERDQLERTLADL